MKILVFANTFNVASGGDKIFVKCCKYWQNHNNKILIVTNEKGFNFCLNSGIKESNLEIWRSFFLDKLNIRISYIYKTLVSVIRGIFLNTYEYEVVFSSSDFLPDVLPALINKIKNKKIKWISAFYLFAPKPWQKNNPYKGKYFIIGVFYWLSQLISYYITKNVSDIVLVTNYDYIKSFINRKRDANKIMVFKGVVDINETERYFSAAQFIPFEKKIYDGCFVGRLHPQKGVLQLIDIWGKVCQKIPKARLAIIGAGILQDKLREKIISKCLQNSVELLGFKDGREKYEVFKISKVFVQPSLYETFGMATVEAMAWGLPVVGFDLESLRLYFTKGMFKVPCFDLNKFSDKIIELLKDKNLYQNTSEEARIYAKQFDFREAIRDLNEILLK
ncbi:MAG: glycosyltransferase [Candidatus Omnitrophica bacterium]|nr:glycosyltransferase [Candidatus Omnitrophota bacterium]